MTDESKWMTLDHMRSLGIREVMLWCSCRRCVTVNVDKLPGHIKVPNVGRHCRCTECGRKGGTTRPNWPPYSAKST